MRSLLLLLLALTLCACSARVRYEPIDEVSAPAAAVNINTATLAELEKLPYLGKRTAEAVVEFRQQNGGFRRPEELLLIRGISEQRFLEIRHLVRTK